MNGNNGGCQQRCYDLYNSYHCGCEAGYTLSNSQTSCPGSASACETSVADIVFILDSSGSIRDANPSDGSYDNWALALQFISNFVNEFNLGTDGTQFGLVTFSYLANNIFYLNSYTDKNQMQSAILNTPYVGSYTNTSGGIRMATYEQYISSRGDRSWAENIAIILTDGVPNRDESFTIPDAEYLRSLGTTIYVVGITNAIDESMLQDMSSQPQQLNGQYFLADDFQALDNIRQTLAAATCNGQEVTSSTQYCFYTEEEGTICLCEYDDCNIAPLNGTTCNNINECNDDENGGCQYQCVDTTGSYYCSCPTGFTLAYDLHGCEDVDECDFNPCSGTTCVNTYGSYYCLSNSVVFNGAFAAALVGADPSLVGSASVSAGVTQQTVVLASALAVVGTLLVVMIVALGLRHMRTSKKAAETDSDTASTAAFNGTSAFGFSLGNKLGNTNLGANFDDDALSTVSSTYAS